MAAKKDGILDYRHAFWIAFAMSDFVDLEEGHNFRGSSFLAKISSSSFDLLRAHLAHRTQIPSSFKIKILTFAVFHK